LWLKSVKQKTYITLPNKRREAVNDLSPKVTVYITTFNRLELLKRAIKSVQKQSYSNIEIIVADDGSSDGSQEYLAKMQDDKALIAIINTSDSKGACYGRNRAIELASGKFITGLDDDDYFESSRIENFVHYWSKLANYNNVAGLFDSVIELRPNGHYKYNETPQADYLSLRKKNLVGNQVFMLVQYLREIGGFDEKMPALQDWDTWLRLTKQYGKLININSYSYVIDQTHEGQRISSKKNKYVRAAFTRLSKKLQPISFSEKIGLLDSMYTYKQMDIVYKELLMLLIGFKLRRFSQVLKRSLLK